MLTEREKEALKSRIGFSIHEYKKKRVRQRAVYFVSTAAAVMVYFFYVIKTVDFQQSTSIEKYVDNTEMDIHSEGDVKLVLNDEEEINISEKMSNIMYSASGEEVKINSDQKVKQTATDNFNTIIVPYGKRTRITLSEGTKVWLNSGSRLTYPVLFNGDRREVHLIGEAIFDVMHNKEKPFYVLTKDYDVQVLGTVFNVSSYEDDRYTSTALERGSVKIKYKGNSIFGKSSVRIEPGTLAIYDSRTKNISTSRVEVSKYLSWRDGKFIFKKQKLSGILKKLSRYYNVNISIESQDLEQETFSGHLDLKENIEKVLEVIKQTTDLKYQNKNGKIIIN